MKNLLTKIILSSALAFSSCSAVEYVFADMPFGIPSDFSEIHPTNVSVTPVFGKCELKQKTSKSSGWLYGARASYDLIKPGFIYVGADVEYKTGELSGNAKIETVVDLPQVREDQVLDFELIEIKESTKSEYTDMRGEVRLGFTFSELQIVKGHITPFALIGYEKEVHKYINPTPVSIEDTLTYNYFGVGVISQISVIDQMSVGLNVKFKWMFDTKHKTSNQNWVSDNEISCPGCFHYIVEIPVVYIVSESVQISINPMYEYKNYDKHKFDEPSKERNSMHMFGGAVNLDYMF